MNCILRLFASFYRQYDAGMHYCRHYAAAEEAIEPPVAAHGQMAANGPAIPVLQPNQHLVGTRIWTEVANVNIDLANGQQYQHQPSLLWQRLLDPIFMQPENRSIWHFYQLLYPWQMMHGTVDSMNAAIRLDPNRSGEDTNLGEYVKYRGIRLASVLDPGPGRFVDNWNSVQEDNTIFTPRRFGERFQMSRNRFLTLERAHKYRPAPTAEEIQVIIASFACCCSWYVLSY